MKSPFFDEILVTTQILQGVLEWNYSFVSWRVLEVFRMQKQVIEERSLSSLFDEHLSITFT